MRYPDIQEVNNATHAQICRWHRFLPSPATKQQLEIINAVYQRFKDGGEMTSTISKQIGWG